MRVRIEEQPIDHSADHASLSTAFIANSRIDLTKLESSCPALPLATLPLVPPAYKNYDTYPGNSPTAWPQRLDVSAWGLLAAFIDDARIGGVVLAHRTFGLELLNDSEDRALVWDLRVAPDARRHGIGVQLLSAARAWACSRGCSVLLVETQDINVPACHLYAATGYCIARIDRNAYPDCPGEASLIWQRALSAPAT